MWFAFCMIFILLFTYSICEVYQLEVTHWSLYPEDEQAFELPNGHVQHLNHLNPKQQPLKVLFFTDIHTRRFSLSATKILDKIQEEDFDLCLIGGDFLTRRKFQKKMLNDLHKMTDYLRKRHIPCFAVAGNHDIHIIKALQHSSALRLLQNQEVVFQDKQKRNWLLYGCSDLKTSQPSFDRLQTILCAGLPQIEAKILLAHNPDTIISAYNNCPNQPFNYFLAGHFHGGQIRLPFGFEKLEFKLLRTETLGRKNHVRGCFSFSNTRCFISRGLGTVLLPLRFRSKPELAILHLYPVQEKWEKQMADNE